MTNKKKLPQNKNNNLLTPPTIKLCSDSCKLAFHNIRIKNKV